MNDRKSAFEIAIDKKQLFEFLHEEELNENSSMHTKECLEISISELTEKQKAYLLLFADGKSIKEIAEMHSVDRSTVSRTVHRALKRLYMNLRFANRRFLHADFLGNKYLTAGKRS